MIGYYAHHHGSGHVTRATSIAGALGEPLTVLSSRERPARSTVDWLTLPLDTEGADGADNRSGIRSDATANGVLHWAPIGVRGMTDRMAMIAEWVARERPRLFVVDVSVEVALFVRLLGVEVVVMAMPGERVDGPHDLVYRVADRIIAPWSQRVYDPEWLRSHAAKTSYVGVVSRFDGRDRPVVDTTPEVLVLGGAGGTALTAADIDAAADANPRYVWRAAGVDAQSWVEDVWPLLCSASVVVTHAGQNAIADVAAARVPAVVIPQERPFGEQVATATALGRAGVAVTTERWPTPERWGPLLDAAAERGGNAWDAVRQSGAAARAAAALSSSAGR
ncbi:MAG: glycosyltransferase [Rhodococcus sp. (in: high G+C Gram-positive bacteria)]